ncbi:MAG TPA: hypothetical protein DCZ73_04280 [Bacteroides sp.]|nr:hypothetical protein [Bacteroides sp.]
MKKVSDNPKKEELAALVSAFCKEKLNDEYEQLCLKLIDHLEEEADSPFRRGNLNIWAAAVVYTIGQVNFLSDKSFEPYLPNSAINEYFGTKPGTVSAKANLIREMLDIDYHFDPEYSTAKMQEQNPFNKLVLVDGMLYPVEMLPEEYQEIVREARSQGRDVSFTTRK